MKDWSMERWRKLYLREALDQRPWSVMARGLRDYLIRLAEDDGALIRNADDPIGALLLALGAHADEAELVRAAIVLLRRDGFLSGDARSMFVRNLPAAQFWEPRAPTTEPETPARPAPVSSSKERVRQFRERQRQAANPGVTKPASSPQADKDATPTVTSGVDGNATSGVTSPVTGVTSSVTDAVTGNVTSSRGSRNLKSSQSFLDLQKDKQTPHPPRSSRARGVTSSVTGPVTGVASAVTASVSQPPETEDEEDQLDFSWDSDERLQGSIKDACLGGARPACPRNRDSSGAVARSDHCRAGLWAGFWSAQPMPWRTRQRPRGSRHLEALRGRLHANGARARGGIRAQAGLVAQQITRPGVAEPRGGAPQSIRRDGE